LTLEQCGGLGAGPPVQSKIHIVTFFKKSKRLLERERSSMCTCICGGRGSRRGRESQGDSTLSMGQEELGAGLSLTTL